MKVSARFKNFTPYTPIEPYEVLSERFGIPIEQIIKLDANENPYGISQFARKALAELSFAHIYPDPESRTLRTALARFTGVPVENLMAGAGADELIDLLLRVLLEPRDKVVNLPPTFGMYSFDTLLNAGQVCDVKRDAEFSIDLSAIHAAVEKQQPKVLFLNTPNNPDGSFPTPQEIDDLLELPLMVVIDEAYIEFTSRGGKLGEEISRIRQVPERQNLVVLRTFSKWAGLAGLRVGYGAFPSWLMPTLWAAKQPYNVNVAASAAALASLGDIDYLAGNIEKLREERARLFDHLLRIPFLHPFPSQSNFILCKVSGINAKDLKDWLARQGILLRYYNTPLLQDYIRISVGLAEQHAALLAALEALIPIVQSGADLSSVVAPSRPVINAPLLIKTPSRQSRVSRITSETAIELTLALDGTGRHQVNTGLAFLDHMLAQVAIHGLFDLDFSARGDLQLDPHHTVEDVALTLGEAFHLALGDRKGIVRSASVEYPMDESLARVSIDFSGRPYAVTKVKWHTPYVGNIPITLIPHFLESFATQARCSLHTRVFYGQDDHHQVEAIFKALGRALDAATRIDPRRAGIVPSSKGVIL